MLTFRVVGPLEVPTYAGKAAKIIRNEEVDTFWARNPALRSEKGCYVFGIRSGPGVTPLYVGQATKDFDQEVFASGKLVKFLQGLANVKVGTPVILLLVHPRGRGATNERAITELERFLIRTLSARYPLLNKQGTKQANWGIAGVLRSGVGPPSIGARALRQMLGL